MSLFLCFGYFSPFNDQGNKCSCITIMPVCYIKNTKNIIASSVGEDLVTDLEPSDRPSDRP